MRDEITDEAGERPAVPRKRQTGLERTMPAAAYELGIERVVEAASTRGHA